MKQLQSTTLKHRYVIDREKAKQVDQVERFATK